MIGINEFKLKRINANIMALYIFQFGLLQPICIAVKSQLPIAVFTLFLLLFMFWENGIKIKPYVTFAFLTIVILFLLNIQINKANKFLPSTLYKFLSMGLSGLLFGSLDIDGDDLYKAFLKYGLINFFVLAPFPFIGLLPKKINYMRFGYAMLPSVIITFYGVTYEKNHRLFLGLISIFALAITVIYGSRGTIIAIMLSVILFFIFNRKISRDIKFLILIVIGIFVIIFIRYDLIYKLLSFIYYDLGIKTYSLKKLIIMFKEGLIESSSGREKIYSHLWTLFIENPILGKGIAVSQYVLGERFTAHNIILQILVEFGFLGLLVWMALWFCCGYKYSRILAEQETGLFIVVTMLISISLGRLMVSSDMWVRPEYWFVFSLLLNYTSMKEIDV